MGIRNALIIAGLVKADYWILAGKRRIAIIGVMERKDKARKFWGSMSGVLLPMFLILGGVDLVSVLKEGEGQPWLSLGLVAVGLLAASSWETGKVVLRRQEGR